MHELDYVAVFIDGFFKFWEIFIPNKIMCIGVIVSNLFNLFLLYNWLFILLFPLIDLLFHLFGFLNLWSDIKCLQDEAAE